MDDEGRSAVILMVRSRYWSDSMYPDIESNTCKYLNQLKAYGADFYQRDHQGKTAYDYAVSGKYPKCVLNLLKLP